MKNMTKRSFVVALALGILSLTIASSSAAPKKVMTEDDLIAELAGPDEDKVANAMLQLEKQFPTSTKAFPTMKKLLTDPREKVRRKAGRVLGVLHAEVNETDLKNITAMFKAANPQEVMDALKSLRGLKAESTVPEILPLLQNSNIAIVRDACRTLSTLGNKSHVAAIEPLLKHPDPKVQKDAQDAIFALNSKS
jgi:HEAT repeat protein